MRETIKKMRSVLLPIYGPGETQAMTRLIFHNLKGWSPTDMIVHEPDTLSDYIKMKIDDILQRLQRQEPLQYILGEASFYGLKLKVNPSVLIPRPETELLVDMIVKRYGDVPDLQVLDIGTGSGAIAIALSRHLPFSWVTGIDVSPDALAVAAENARLLKTKTVFEERDVFAFNPPADTYDIIVSNPPYVDEQEKAQMEKNVLDYEPHDALFVPDDNPLIFYSRISEMALKALKNQGSLYFEINPRHAEALVKMLRHEGYVEIEMHRDFHGRDRFISATLQKP